MPATAFSPPAADLLGKPVVPEWVPPPVTKENENFADLESIDLSLIDSSDPVVVDGLTRRFKAAIRDDGFLFLENYGVSLEQVRSTLLSKENRMQTSSSRRLMIFHLFIRTSFTVNSVLPSTFTTTSVSRIRIVLFSALRPACGPATNIPMDLRYLALLDVKH